MKFEFQYNVPVSNQPSWLQDTSFTLHMQCMYMFDFEDGTPVINCSVKDMGLFTAQRVKDWVLVTDEVNALAIQHYNRLISENINAITLTEKSL